jgi:hypothetical protein
VDFHEIRYAGDAIEEDLDATFLISYLQPFQNGGRWLVQRILLITLEPIGGFG